MKNGRLFRVTQNQFELNKVIKLTLSTPHIKVACIIFVTHTNYRQYCFKVITSQAKD